MMHTWAALRVPVVSVIWYPITCPGNIGPGYYYFPVPPLPVRVPYGIATHYRGSMMLALPAIVRIPGACR